MFLPIKRPVNTQKMILTNIPGLRVSRYSAQAKQYAEDDADNRSHVWHRVQRANDESGDAARQTEKRPSHNRTDNEDYRSAVHTMPGRRPITSIQNISTASTTDRTAPPTPDRAKYAYRTTGVRKSLIGRDCGAYCIPPMPGAAGLPGGYAPG